MSELINKELQIYIENLLNDDLDIDNLKSMFNKYVFSKKDMFFEKISKTKLLSTIK